MTTFFIFLVVNESIFIRKQDVARELFQNLQLFVKQIFCAYSHTETLLRIYHFHLISMLINPFIYCFRGMYMNSQGVQKHMKENSSPTTMMTYEYL